MSSGSELPAILLTTPDRDAAARVAHRLAAQGVRAEIMDGLVEDAGAGPQPQFGVVVKRAQYERAEFLVSRMPDAPAVAERQPSPAPGAVATVAPREPALRLAGTEAQRPAERGGPSGAGRRWMMTLAIAVIIPVGAVLSLMGMHPGAQHALSVVGPAVLVAGAMILVGALVAPREETRARHIDDDAA